MIRIFATASAVALACAAPAIAQDTASAPVPTPDMASEAPADLGPDTATPVDPAPADPVSSTSIPAPAAPIPAAQPAPVAQAPAPAAQPTPATQAPATQAPAADYKTQVAAVVESEFPAYDGDRDGNLTEPEFGKWLLALREAAGQQQPVLDDAGKANWVKDAFAQADADKSMKISKAEMNSFLAG